jgi:hypothetical protein
LRLDKLQQANIVTMSSSITGGYMPFVYKAVRTLAGQPLVGTGDCVELVKSLAPGLKGVPTGAWKAGD